MSHERKSGDQSRGECCGGNLLRGNTMRVAVRLSFVLLLLAGCGSGADAPEFVASDDVQPSLVLTPPPPATANAQGPTQAIADATITVADVQYAVVAGQTIVRRGGVAVPLSALKRGDSAVVKGAPAADGSLVAQTVDVYLLPTPFPEWVTIKALIAVGADSITVLGQTFRVDAHTLIVRAGRTVVPLTNLRNGEAASVTGRPSLDNSLLASSINVGN